MKGSGGDIRAVLSLDDFEYIHGLERSVKATKKGVGDMQQSMAGTGGGAGAGLARGIGQGAFALQDFTSVLAMGGKGALSRALMSTMNNVQMLGMAFGPTGAAITAVAGAIGSVMLPKLLEGETAFERIGAEITAATDRLDKFIQRGSRMTDFMAGLNKTDTGKGAEDLAARNDLEIKKKTDEFAALQGRMGELAAEKAKLSMARGSTGAGQDFMDSWSSPTKLIGLASATIEGIDGSLKTVQGDLDKVQIKARDAAAELAQLQKQKDAIKDRTVDIRIGIPENFAKEQHDLIQHEKERTAETARIKHQVATPLERAQEEIERLKGLHDRGDIDDDLFRKAGKHAISEMGRANHVDQKNVGVGGIGGSNSASWYEAMRDSQRSAKNPADQEKINLLKRQIQEAEKTRKATERLYDKVGVVEVDIA